jgi:hypothetical protein
MHRGGCWDGHGGRSGESLALRVGIRRPADTPIPVQLREHSEPRGQLGREERDGLSWRYVPSGEGTRFGALCVRRHVSRGGTRIGSPERRTDGVV